MDGLDPTPAGGLPRILPARRVGSPRRGSWLGPLGVAITVLIGVLGGLHFGGIPAPTAVPSVGSGGMHPTAAAHSGVAPQTQPGGLVHRFAAVPLTLNRPSSLSGQPAWLAYDSADQLFYVAVPPDLVEVVPGDFGYDPVVIATIPVGSGPFGVAYDNATGDVFVTNSLSANVSVIAGSSARLLATIPVGTGPMGVAFDPVSRDVYVANNASNNVSIISDTRLAVVATVGVGTAPLGVAADPSSGDVFVANHGSGNLSVISGRTNGVTATVALPSGPYGVTIDGPLHRAYVTEQTAGDVSAVSDANYSVLANISVPCGSGCYSLSLEGLAFDSGNGLIYVGGGRTSVAVILPSNNSLLDELNFDPAGVAYNPDTGDICVTNTANATFECAIFGHPTVGALFSVQFSETGLPAGTTWYASVDAAQGQSNGTSIAIAMGNGTFPYSVDFPYSYNTYHPNPATGLVTVAGANVTIPIVFARGTYLVDVVESGLPTGTPWSAELGFWTSYSTNDTNWFNVSNGTYELSLGAALNYSASPFSQRVTVSGASVVVNVTYAGATHASYPVTFAEAGLAAGTRWSVTLDGVNQTTSASSLTFREGNGSYAFAASATGYAASPATGTVVVNGSAPTQTITFTSTMTWRITLHETGLPNGTDWGVLIGSEAQSSTSSDLTFARLNGTYGYLVLPVAGYVTSPPAPIVVNGSNQVVLVSFSPQLYPIVFVELGLPLGSNWSVTVTDNATGYNRSLSSTSSSIIFFLPNGTYLVTFTLPAGFNGTASSTSVTVAGRAATGATVSVNSPSSAPTPALPVELGTPVVTVALALAVVGLLVLLLVLFRSRRPPAKADRAAP